MSERRGYQSNYRRTGSSRNFGVRNNSQKASPKGSGFSRNLLIRVESRNSILSNKRSSRFGQRSQSIRSSKRVNFDDDMRRSRSRPSRKNSVKSFRSARSARSFGDRGKQFAPSEVSFNSQEDVDGFNMMRRGYQSPMRGFGEDFFMNLLKTQYDLETELERMKEQLVINCTDFNSVVGFRLFNPPKDRTQNMTIENMLHAYRSLGVNLTYENAKLLMKRYDNDRDGKITYTDICDIFKPREPTLAKELKTRLPFDHKSTEKNLSYQTLACLRTLFHKTLQVEQNIELLKCELHSRPDFNMSRAFESINRTNASGNENFISQFEFKDILRSHGVYAMDRDVKSLFNRFDKDGDGKINYKDFANEMITVGQS